MLWKAPAATPRTEQMLRRRIAPLRENHDFTGENAES
jgi:hypothetical protein